MTPAEETILKPEQIQALATTYYDQLDKPESAKQPPQFCVCPIGLVGSGKSTVLKKICEQLPVIFVSADAIREIMIAQQLPTDDAMYVTHLVCIRLKEQGYNIAHDGDFARPVARQLLEKANKGRRIRVLWFRMITPEDVILQRLRSRVPTLIFPTVEGAVEVYERRKLVHETTPDLNDIPYLYKFDASRDDLDQQVDEFVAKARKELYAT